MPIFSGTNRHKMDAKGRVSVPASFRAEVEKDTNTKAFFVTLSLDRDCLAGYDVDEARRVMNGFQERSQGPGIPSEDDARNELFFGEGMLLEYDKAGRIQLPQQLRDYAAFEDECVFVGRGYFFEIRSPQVHDEVRKEALARRAAVRGAK